MKERDYRFDNIKCLLIFLVVFGHLIELLEGDRTDLIYRTIYLFHMPAFIFMTGRLASFKPKRVLAMFYAYFVTDTVYIWFYGRLYPEADIHFAYFSPFWITWYLLALAMYLLLLPVAGELRPWKCAGMFIAIIALSLLAGRDTSLGYAMTMERFLAFMPYFFAGYFIKGLPQLREKLDLVMKRKWRPLLALPLLGVLYVLCRWDLFHAEVTRFVLYEAFPYDTAYYGPKLKLLLMITAFCFILLLFLLAPNVKIPVLSMIGKNTLPVFLLHGLLVQYLRTKTIFIYSEMHNLEFAAAIAAGMCIFFALPPISWLVNELLAGHLFGQIYTGLQKAFTGPKGKRERG